MSTDACSHASAASPEKGIKADVSLPDDISQRVFLVGCPRSGTTLLQSMLMSHTRIASFPETHFFDRGFGGRRRWILHETLRGGYLWYLLVNWLVQKCGMPWRQAVQTPLLLSKRSMVRVFQQTLDRLALQNGEDVWVEKTPRHLHFLSRIEQTIEQPRFVHIVRDGRAVVASAVHLAHTHPEKWSHFQDVDAAIERWNRCVSISLQVVDRPNHAAVQYQRLVDKPEAVLTSLAAFLDVDYEPAMANQFNQAARSVVNDYEAWKSKNRDAPLESQELKKFRSVFSPEEQHYIEDRLDVARFRDLQATIL
jgi:hypothetical protein